LLPIAPLGSRAWQGSSQYRIRIGDGGTDRITAADRQVHPALSQRGSPAFWSSGSAIRRQRRTRFSGHCSCVRTPARRRLRAPPPGLPSMHQAVTTGVASTH